MISLKTEPISAAREIPNNYYRQVLLVDSTLEPEMIPGLVNAARSGTVDPRYLIFDVWRATLDRVIGEYRSKGIIFKAGVILGTALQSALICLPGLLFRLTLKATAPMLLPLVLWCRESESSSLHQRLDSIRNGELEKWKYRLSVVVITLGILFAAIKLVMENPRLLSESTMYIAILATQESLGTVFKRFSSTFAIMNALLIVLIRIWSDKKLREIQFRSDSIDHRDIEMRLTQLQLLGKLLTASFFAILVLEVVWPLAMRYL